MENNISLSSINNRKIILEIRFEANPLVIDIRGKLAKKLQSENIIANSKWELGNGDLKIVDDLNPDNTRQLVYVDSQRFTVICSNNQTTDSFLNIVNKSYKIFTEIIGEIVITRIGCRILGTYKTKSTDYSTVVSNFKALFPSQVLLEEFVVKDLRLQLIYQNGQYNIGPISKDDNFLKNEFRFDDVVKSVGFAIDTDNYILKSTEKQSISETSIKDVYLTSLSVEKSLFDKLNTL